uniref:proteinase-activated receptor 4 isoform X2 n=1 Tax=Centroberyx gerrardi TaxID=166262 RepID=UPI003AACDE43
MLPLGLRAFKLMKTCNYTTLKDKHQRQLQAPITNLYIPILYLLAFGVGLPANLLALWVLLFRTKKLPSTVLLINLTATDFMLLLVLPFRIVYHFKGNNWDLGEPLCRVVTAMFYGNMYGSVLCLALVALDRYIALVHPFGAKTLRSKRTSLYMSAAVWLVVLAAMLPLLLSRQSYPLDEPRITTCHDALPEEEQENYFVPYFSSLFILFFLLPFLVILFCYGAVLRTLVAAGDRYNHAVRVTVLVLLVFIVCLLPSNILLLLTYCDSCLDGDGDGDGDGDDLYVPYMVSLAVSTFNSCIDPFIFYYVSDDFREKVRRVLFCDYSKTPSSSGNNVSYSSSSGRSKVTFLSKSSGTSDGDAA